MESEKTSVAIISGGQSYKPDELIDDLIRHKKKVADIEQAISGVRLNVKNACLFLGISRPTIKKIAADGNLTEHENEEGGPYFFLTDLIRYRDGIVIKTENDEI